MSIRTTKVIVDGIAAGICQRYNGAWHSLHWARDKHGFLKNSVALGQFDSEVQAIAAVVAVRTPSHVP